VALFILSNTDAIAGITDRLFAPSVRKDDMPYAHRMAETLIDTLVCARFKQAILVAGKGPLLSGATKHKIINEYNEVFFTLAQKTGSSFSIR